MRRFLLYFLAAMAGAVMCSAKPGTVGSNQKNSRNAVVIEISPSGFGREAPHVYPQKNPIKIRCVIRNTGKRSVDFQLKDHDAYHGTLPYPIGTAVQVVSDGGEVVTANDIDRSGEGWWSQYFVWSTTFEPFMPGDNIHIPPGGEVIRQIPIDEVLLMSPNTKSGLPEGTYKIRIRINGILSNAITIKVGPNQ